MSQHAMSQLSCSFTRSNWSWDLLIDLICMQRETSGTNRGEKVNVMLIFYPSEFASSCARCTLTICRSYRYQMTQSYCKLSSSLSGCEDAIKMYFRIYKATARIMITVSRLSLVSSSHHHYGMNVRTVNLSPQLVTHYTWHTESHIVDNISILIFLASLCLTFIFLGLLNLARN